MGYHLKEIQMPATLLEKNRRLSVGSHASRVGRAVALYRSYVKKCMVKAVHFFMPYSYGLG